MHLKLLRIKYLINLFLPKSLSLFVFVESNLLLHLNISYVQSYHYINIFLLIWIIKVMVTSQKVKQNIDIFICGIWSLDKSINQFQYNGSTEAILQTQMLVKFCYNKFMNTSEKISLKNNWTNGCVLPRTYCSAFF